MLQDKWDSHEKTDIIKFEFPAKLALKWGNNCLQKKTFPREDYRELIKIFKNIEK